MENGNKRKWVKMGVLFAALVVFIAIGFLTKTFSFSSIGKGITLTFGNIVKIVIMILAVIVFEMLIVMLLKLEDDRTFMIEILCAARQVSLLKECLYNWRFNNGSETYRRRYVTSLPEKMKRYQAYEKKILTSRGMDKNALTVYLRCESCNNLILLVSNEYGVENRRKFPQKIRYLRKQIYTEDFKTVIRERKRLGRNIIRRRAVLFLLACHLPGAAYLFQITYAKLKVLALSFPQVTRMERRLTVKTEK